MSETTPAASTHLTMADYFASIPRYIEPARTEIAAQRVSDAAYDAICEVIDRVKMDERSLDTDEYASEILAALEIAS